MRDPVLAHQTAAVQAQGHVQILQADVVHDLVVGALHEGGIDGHQRLHPLGSQPSGEGHGMLLADAHVEEAVGKTFRKTFEPRAFGHCDNLEGAYRD